MHPQGRPAESIYHRAMAFPPSVLDDIRARLSVSQVVGRKVALKKAGREWKGLSPFKVEKTPSFYVNDQKGFYHCFASGEHGDIFKFLMRTEGLTFPEAVERLAEEAGVPLPKFEPRNPEREDQRERLFKLMEASAAFFETALKGPAAGHARKYIAEKRGLAGETVAKFRMGYAPSSKNALKEHLAGLGYTNEEMITSGMLIGGDDIPVSYDRFRNRVMFPITDLKNRVIAFGGRALDADAPAKYLNSPETPLFHKGHILFHAAAARSAAHDRGRVIAVEGYMDVVALAAAGFVESVAPLGTALTEEQLKLLWRMAGEPILCFDGDGAGRRAAWRAIDTALPHLVAGKSLRFAFLPDGYDPDDLVRQEGPAAMERVLETTRSFADVLFEREWGQGEWATPERRAHLEQQLFGLVGKIADESVRGHYAQDMRDRLTRLWGVQVRLPQAVVVREPAPGSQSRGYPRDDRQGRFGARRDGTGPGRVLPNWPPKTGLKAKWQPPGLLDLPLPASDALKQSRLGGAATAPSDLPAREALLLKALLNHPWLLEDRSEEVAALAFASRSAGRLRDALLDLQARDIPLDSREIRTQLTGLGFEAVIALIDRSITHRADRFVEPEAERTAVTAGWRHALILHHRDALSEALAEAEAQWLADQTEEAFARIAEIKRLQSRPVDLDDPGA
jgi:DNA primase